MNIGLLNNKKTIYFKTSVTKKEDKGNSRGNAMF